MIHAPGTPGARRLSPRGGSLFPMSDRPGLFRRALSRITSSDEETLAAELRHEAVERGGTCLDQVGDRQRVCIAGTLRTVVLRPRAGVPALEAELYDGSGTARIVWLGRRRIPGIEPGRVVVARGLLSQDHGMPTMFNPRYELKASVAE